MEEEFRTWATKTLDRLIKINRSVVNGADFKKIDGQLKEIEDGLKDFRYRWRS